METLKPLGAERVVRELQPDLGYVDSDYLDPAEIARAPGRRRGRTRPEPDVATADIPVTLERLRQEMLEHAKKMEFEEAAVIRDRLRSLERLALL